MAWAKLGTNTLTSGGNTMQLEDVSDTTNHTYMTHVLHGGVSTTVVFRVGNGSLDSGTNYANRIAWNGGTDSTITNDAEIRLNVAGTMQESFTIFYGYNKSSEEKLFIEFVCASESTGAGSAPSRNEGVHKWANTSDTITDVGMVNIGSNDMDTDSNFTGLGTN